MAGLYKDRVLASGLSRDVLPLNEVRETRLNQPSDEQRSLPFYSLIPKDPVECLKWKLYVRKRCLHDLEFRAVILEACRQDVAFFANTLCWVFEPRPPRPLPLTLWPDQADCLVWIAECFATNRDIGIEKTRGIGMSWTIAVFVMWLWLFHKDCKIGLMTKDETVLDGPDSNFLIGKLVYIFDKMPAWMKYDKVGRSIMKRNLSAHTIENESNGAMAQGFPPMESKVRGLRFSFFVYDEFAFFPRDAQEALNASVHTAPCRAFISTWKGHANCFHEIMRVEKSTLLRVQAYWWNNPERWRGCYTSEKHRLKIIDTSYEYPPDYPFVLDGLMRSPWVDFELSRAGGGNLQSAMEELYGLTAEAGRKLFRPTTCGLVENTVTPPLRRGTIEFTGAEPIFIEGDGELFLYADIGNGKAGPFAAASDLAFGRGAAYSTLEVIDLSSKEQVAELATNTVDIVSFAKYVFHFLLWLNGDKFDGHTYLTFENNGDLGNAFGNEMTRLGYGNIHRRKYRGRLNRDQEATYLGTRNTDGGLGAMLELERAIRDGDTVVRSAYAADEMQIWALDEKGKPAFPSKNDGHGDRVQGLALAWNIAKERLVAAPAERLVAARAEIEEYDSGPAPTWSDCWTLNNKRRF